MLESLQRVRRIVGREINGKTLPAFVYRQDERAPEVIRAQGGFEPWGQDPVSIIDHVTGTYAAGPKKGELVKHDSSWVSTAAWRAWEDLGNMSGVLANRMLTSFLYKIDTQRAGAQDFADVNDAFDKAGLKFEHRQQREWIKKGSIPINAIVGWMAGRDFFDRFSGNKAPAENSPDLPWQPIP